MFSSNSDSSVLSSYLKKISANDLNLEYTNDRIMEILEDIKFGFDYILTSSDSNKKKFASECINALASINYKNFGESVDKYLENIGSDNTKNSNDNEDLFLNGIYYIKIMSNSIQATIEMEFYSSKKEEGFYLFTKKSDGQIVNDIRDFSNFFSLKEKLLKNIIPTCVKNAKIDNSLSEVVHCKSCFCGF